MCKKAIMLPAGYVKNDWSGKDGSYSSRGDLGIIGSDD